MTPKMFAALDAAKAAGGLAYTVGGYADHRSPPGYHNFGSISALRDRGYLSIEGKGKKRRALITVSGRHALKLEQSRLRVEGQPC
jgi:hypothetical protein